jgi:hypothetical protein
MILHSIGKHFLALAQQQCIKKLPMDAKKAHNTGHSQNTFKWKISDSEQQLNGTTDF